MYFIVRNVYLSSSDYLTWASEGLLSWTLKLLGHIGRIIFSERIINCANVEWNTSAKLSTLTKDSAFDSDACEMFFHELTKTNENKLEYGALQDLACTISSTKDAKIFNIIIILSYKMKTKSFVSWTKQEWLRGMQELRIHSMEQLLAQRDDLMAFWDDDTNLREMWRYSYDAAKGDSKDMGTPFVKALVEAFFMNRWTLWTQFSSYLDEMRIKSLTKDQFYSLFDFQRCVNSDKDLMNYDFEGAWPTLLDEFIEFVNSNQNETYCK